MSTTRQLHKDFASYDNNTSKSLNEKIKADTAALEEWNKQGRLAGLIYVKAPLGSAAPQVVDVSSKESEESAVTRGPRV